MTIHPVILSGGAGTRLWPLSRHLYPKQLLPLVSDETLIVETARRVAGDGFAPPIVVCNDEHRFVVADQLRSAAIGDATIVLEPEGRNTAPAAALGTRVALDRDAEALVLVLPSDHAIGDPAHFRNAVDAATAAARSGHLVTFGIHPREAATGYGYIRRGDPLVDLPGCHAVDEFVEKPDADHALTYVSSGAYLWNSGMFLFQARTFLDELARFAPAMRDAADAAVAGAVTDLDFFRPAGEAFAASPAGSIDYTVMERTDHAAVVPVDMRWSDVGSWSELWQLADKDLAGNATVGDVIVGAASNCYLRTDGPLLAVHGVADLAVVATDDAVLVVERGRSQDVRHLVDRVAKEGREEHLAHLRVHRPWGWYQTMDSGDGFLVKRLYLKPNARLSLQYHDQRAEHWVVVAGTARVTRGEDVTTLTTNQSTYIPAGVPHRLENPADTPLYVIEVQSGSYLGEDDIVRIKDDFQRN